MSLEDKVCLPCDLQLRLSELPRPLVMTNGVFDILHRGHVDYLHRAAQLGASLLVAVNTDASARMLGKGPDRPLNKDLDRAYVLASLSSVSMVTFFDTQTPVELIEAIRPDIYLKGGDYDMETLEETRVVRSWGGQSVAIPFVDGFSTTALVQRIRQPALPALRKAVFLDRDGVINEDHGYVHNWSDFKFIPGAIEGLHRLYSAGYILIIVTNQSGIARGYYNENQYSELTNRMLEELLRHDINISSVYHCPHHPEALITRYKSFCECRKPAAGMIFSAQRDFNIDLSGSILIGDKLSDILAARTAGVGRAYMVGCDKDVYIENYQAPDGCYINLLDCVKYILNFD
jgi:rfaE bifunctional protein nucleotidyltransferase chain/domain